MINWTVVNSEIDVIDKITKVSVLVTAELDSFKQNKYIDVELESNEEISSDDLLGLVKEKLGEIEVDKIEEKLINFVEAKKAEKEAKASESGLL